MKVVIAHQTFVSKDAIGHDIIEEYNCLKENGIDVCVYAENNSSDVADIVNKKSVDYLCEKDTLLIYHHSIYWEKGNELLKKAKGKVVIKYHNITPSHFFLPYSSDHFNKTLLGQKQTLEFARDNGYFLFSDSEYNSKDFTNLGYKGEVMIIPPFNKISDFENIYPDSNVIKKLKGVEIKVIFVGRIAPNKGHKHIIMTAYYYRLLFGNNIIFYIIGDLDSALNVYYEELIRLINKLNLQEMIIFTRKVSMQELKAYYLSSDVFLCLSEHEGFCVPILEAQFFKVPIIAHNSTAIKDTVGKNQLVFDKIDYCLIASTIQEIAKDENTKNYLVDNGSANYKKYNRYTLRNIFMQNFRNVLEGSN